MKRKSSRRDFLTGRAAADAMADVVDGRLPGDDRQCPANRATGRSYLVHVARRAMASEFEVCFHAGQYEHDTESALEALSLVEALEDQMSVFRQTSEICRINRTAAQQPVEVEPRLFELLELAARLHAETEGAFDLTAGALWSLWGFARRGVGRSGSYPAQWSGTVPAEEQLAETLQHVGSHLVELDPRHKSIRFSRQGVQLNLGGIGKGYALDRCAEKLHEAGIADFLLHGGRSSVLARGSQRRTPRQPAADAPRGWTVGLGHPLRGDRRLAEIVLRDRALATSGSRVQSFVHLGRRYGHILDPRTGLPAEGRLLSATVLAPSAAQADALSTAFYVMGPQPALDYCRDRPEIAAVLVCPVRRGRGIEIRSAGLGEDDLRLL